ncbi:hypothetical protein K1T71_002260 [Dendrolimus kikuchii]|uniref:Uncharacterized protein n=1 Tax=Dendrolimus kikuchii TaxID=765133 RepID=A0ACC1DC67_9NEOP|nr:hypothetical protein K1T71_002260 [Dendrolimus kikuchii]
MNLVREEHATRFIEIIEPNPEECPVYTIPREPNVPFKLRLLNENLHNPSDPKAKLMPRFDVSAISPSRSKILELLRPEDPGRDALEAIVRPVPRRGLTRPLDEDTRRFLQKALESPSFLTDPLQSVTEPQNSDEQSIESTPKSISSQAERSLADELKEAEEDEQSGSHIGHELLCEFRRRGGGIRESVERERLGKLALSVEEDDEDDAGLCAAARRIDALLAESRDLHEELAGIQEDLQTSPLLSALRPGPSPSDGGSPAGTMSYDLRMEITEVHDPYGWSQHRRERRCVYYPLTVLPPVVRNCFSYVASILNYTSVSYQVNASIPSVPVMPKHEGAAIKAVGRLLIGTMAHQRWASCVINQALLIIGVTMAFCGHQKSYPCLCPLDKYGVGCMDLMERWFETDTDFQRWSGAGVSRVPARPFTLGFVARDESWAAQLTPARTPTGFAWVRAPARHPAAVDTHRRRPIPAVRAAPGPSQPAPAAMRARALPLLTALIAASTLTYAEKSKFYYMESLCKDHFLQRQYRKVDGGVLWSRNERNLDCTVTFQTHSILQRFMLHFDLLQLDCNDHLYVYDGAHATPSPKADLSCRNTKQQVGALFTRSNFVTLKYVTDNWGTDANGFKLVITSVKDPKHGCKEFRCKQREFCVSADLTCDGVDHCADGSDEDTALLCPESGSSGAGTTWLVVLVAGCAALTLAVAAAACCLCRRRASSHRTHLHLQQMASSNGSGAASSGVGVGVGLGVEAGNTRLPGNWALPAGPRGLEAARAGRLRPRARKRCGCPVFGVNKTQCKFNYMTLNIFGLLFVCY